MILRVFDRWKQSAPRHDSWRARSSERPGASMTSMCRHSKRTTMKISVNSPDRNRVGSGNFPGGFPVHAGTATPPPLAIDVRGKQPPRDERRGSEIRSDRYYVLVHVALATCRVHVRRDDLEGTPSLIVVSVLQILVDAESAHLVLVSFVHRPRRPRLCSIGT